MGLGGRDTGPGGRTRAGRVGRNGRREASPRTAVPEPLFPPGGRSPAPPPGPAPVRAAGLPFPSGAGQAAPADGELPGIRQVAPGAGGAPGPAAGALVTAVEVQQKRADRVNVYLDGDFGFAVALSVAQEAGLRRGLRLDQDEVRRLLDQDDQHRAYEAALSFLSYRPRSEAEVRQSLERKRFAPERIAAALARLRGAGLLDDAAFARYWVENRDAFSPRGGRALRAELRQKGVGDQETRAVLEDGRDEAAGAYAAGERKARQLKGLDRRTFRQRLGAYLARRGFSYDSISEAVDRLYAEVGGEAPADDADEGAEEP